MNLKNAAKEAYEIERERRWRSVEEALKKSVLLIESKKYQEAADILKEAINLRAR